MCFLPRDKCYRIVLYIKISEIIEELIQFILNFRDVELDVELLP
jgi:hypothetical protein